MSDCLSPLELEAFSAGAMSGQKRALAEAHIAKCHDCRRAVADQRLF